MTEDRYSEWQPIRKYGEGAQPRTGRHWNCLPAWDVVAIHKGPDGEIPHPDFFRARAGKPGEHPNRNLKKFVFWDRHIDRRFYIEYPTATKESPRVQGILRDPDREWETLIELRDRYLRDAGLTPSSPPEKVARCLAESFGANSYFPHKPKCPAFPGDERALNSGLEGVMYQSHCVGCARGYAIMVDSLGLPSRNLGCEGHWVAEVKVNGRWHMVDSVGRHPEHAGTDLFFRSNYMECALDPMGDHADHMEDLRDGFWRRLNPQFHFHNGQWASPLTLRYAASNAYALYPESNRWAIFSPDGKRLPILMAAGGFYWPTVHDDWDGAEIRRLRMHGYPAPFSSEPRTRDYFFHSFRAGDKLRQSIWLGSLDDAEAIEVAITFAPSRASDFSALAGRRLFLRVGDFRSSLLDLSAWPPRWPDGSTPANNKSPEMLVSKATLPPHLFNPDSVNWIELQHEGACAYFMPLVPSVMEPYICPLWTETEDRHNPPAV